MIKLSRSVVILLTIVALGFPLWLGADDSKPSHGDHKAFPNATQRAIGFTGSLLIQLRASDLDRAIAFYEKVLGFELFLHSEELSWAKLRSPANGVVIGIGLSQKARGAGRLHSTSVYPILISLVVCWRTEASSSKGIR